jgi:hypothetical protein
MDWIDRQKAAHWAAFWAVPRKMAERDRNKIPGGSACRAAKIPGDSARRGVEQQVTLIKQARGDLQAAHTWKPELALFKPTLPHWTTYCNFLWQRELLFRDHLL